MSQGRQLWSLARGPRDVLHGLRLQLALLERDFDELDYDALRALDPDNPPDVRAFSEVGDFAVYASGRVNMAFVYIQAFFEVGLSCIQGFG
jgi:hypothetical protein